MDTNLAFPMKSRVKLVESEERGTVIARAEYENDEPWYLVRYKAADGRQCVEWWRESSLEHAESAEE